MHIFYLWNLYNIDFGKINHIHKTINRYESIITNGNHVSSRISSRISKCIELFFIDAFYSSFSFENTIKILFETKTSRNDSSWESKSIYIFILDFGQDNTKFSTINRKDNNIKSKNRNSKLWIPDIKVLFFRDKHTNEKDEK